MSNYTQPQFHLYRNKPTEELVKLLQSDSTGLSRAALPKVSGRQDYPSDDPLRGRPQAGAIPFGVFALSLRLSSKLAVWKDQD
jgi:hypothetical protein